MYDLHGGVGTKPLTAQWEHVILVHELTNVQCCFSSNKNRSSLFNAVLYHDIMCLNHYVYLYKHESVASIVSVCIQHSHKVRRLEDVGEFLFRSNHTSFGRENIT